MFDAVGITFAEEPFLVPTLYEPPGEPPRTHSGGKIDHVDVVANRFAISRPKQLRHPLHEQWVLRKPSWHTNAIDRRPVPRSVSSRTTRKPWLIFVLVVLIRIMTAEWYMPPKLYAMTIQLSSARSRLFIIGSVKVDGADSVSVLV